MLTLITVGAIAGTYVWRGIGVMFAARIKSDGPVFQWVTFVSYAMLGGLIARMVILPIGPLLETPLLVRALAFVIGVGVFFGVGKRVLPAVFTGVASFIFLVSYF
jgi:branched-subunit amino acid transport protein